MKKVLLLCASHNDLGLIWALRKLGYFIISTGSMPGLIGEKYVDEYIQADYSDKNLILDIAKRKRIDVICSCCNDFGVYTAAYVAEKLGLPGYDSYETTLVLHNKDRFKKFAKQNHIPTPEAEMFSDPQQAYEFIQRAVYPMIIKPTDCSAGNGIRKVENQEEAFEAVKEAFLKSRAGRIVIEDYISGTQHGFCTFLLKQKVAAYCSNNEYSMINPYRVEIDTFPADKDSQVSGLLIEQIEKMAKVLSLQDGIFHLQYIMNPDGKVQIIEVMRRTIGNMYWYPASMRNGFDWNYWEARARCGLSCEGFPKGLVPEGFYAYKAILAEENGTIQSIQIPEKYEKNLIRTVILKQEGDLITHCTSEPIGFFFFNFSSAEEMRQVLVEDYNNSSVTVKKERV